MAAGAAARIFPMTRPFANNLSRFGGTPKSLGGKSYSLWLLPLWPIFEDKATSKSWYYSQYPTVRSLSQHGQCYPQQTSQNCPWMTAAALFWHCLWPIHCHCSIWSFSSTSIQGDLLLLNVYVPKYLLSLNTYFKIYFFLTQAYCINDRMAYLLSKYDHKNICMLCLFYNCTARHIKYSVSI
jgi:hypothetical protein